jgi:ATP-dependent protease ClpP protease subunit
MDIQNGIRLRAMAADATEATIDIVGVIGWDVAFPVLRSMLAGIPDTVERVVFDIYSPGGDVWDGNAIIHEIGSMKQETVARVRVAASMATLIAVACDRREMNANGRWLIHNPWTAAIGDADELEKRAKELRDAEVEAAEFYAARTGKTAEEMIDLMAQERWIRAPEAKELGFVHEVIDPFDVSAYAQARKAIEADGKWPRALADMPDEDTEEEDDADTTDDGAAVDAPPDAPVGDQPADDPPEPEPAPADEPGAADGEPQPDETATDTIVAVRVQQATVKLSEALEEARAEVAKREALARSYQSERDQLQARIEKLTARHEKETRELRESLDAANARLSKLTLGSLSFSPSGVETWAEAMEQCGGDYAEARKRYPEVYHEMRAQQKRGRK